MICRPTKAHTNLAAACVPCVAAVRSNARRPTSATAAIDATLRTREGTVESATSLSVSSSRTGEPGASLLSAATISVTLSCSFRDRARSADVGTWVAFTADATTGETLSTLAMTAAEPICVLTSTSILATSGPKSLVPRALAVCEP